MGQAQYVLYRPSFGSFGRDGGEEFEDGVKFFEWHFDEDRWDRMHAQFMKYPKLHDELKALWDESHGDVLGDYADGAVWLMDNVGDEDDLQEKFEKVKAILLKAEKEEIAEKKAAAEAAGEQEGGAAQQ